MLKPSRMLACDRWPAPMPCQTNMFMLNPVNLPGRLPWELSNETRGKPRQIRKPHRNLFPTHLLLPLLRRLNPLRGRGHRTLMHRGVLSGEQRVPSPTSGTVKDSDCEAGQTLAVGRRTTGLCVFVSAGNQSISTLLTILPGAGGRL